MLSKSNYDYKSWNETYQSHKVNLKKLKIHKDWKDIFVEIYNDKKYEKLEKELSKYLEESKGTINIFPYPKQVFSAFNLTPLNKLKVVILGQDPYHGQEYYIEGDESPEDSDEYKMIPQAMGLSFSVPVGFQIPSSLKNIYKNMIKYKQLDEYPNHGNLESWAKQGVMLLNCSLTVKQKKPNSHAKLWTWMTDKIIKHISDKTENVIFVLWGRYAYNKNKLIDDKKHKIIASSHPSGLSYAKKMGNFSSFKDQNHFGMINDYLTNNKKKPINWNSINLK